MSRPLLVLNKTRSLDEAVSVEKIDVRPTGDGDLAKRTGPRRTTVKATSGPECEMRNTLCGDLERGPHMTLDVGSPSLVPDHGDAGLQYVGWPCQLHVRIQSRACVGFGVVRKGWGGSRKKGVRPLLRQLLSRDQWNRRQVYGSQGGKGVWRGHSIAVRMASGTRLGRIRMFGAGSHQRFTARVIENSS